MGHLQNIDQGQCLPTCERQARPLLTLRSDDGGKSIYEAMHPETKQHVAGGKAGGRGRPKDIATDNVAVANFADDASTKTGKSARTVRRSVALGEKLSDAAVEILGDSPAANSKVALKALAALPVEEQEAEATRLASGKRWG